MFCVNYYFVEGVPLNASDPVKIRDMIGPLYFGLVEKANGCYFG